MGVACGPVHGGVGGGWPGDLVTRGMTWGFITSAALTLVTEATPLRPGPALFEAMLEGWRRQQAARRLTGALIDGRERVVRRFGAFTGGLPWQWTPGQVETWIAGVRTIRRSG